MTLIFRKPIPNVEHPEMPADVVIVGGGPAGMACALRLSQLIDDHNTRHPDAPSARKISTCSKRRARPDSTAFPARSSIRAP
jgi:hypothetical protein